MSFKLKHENCSILSPSLSTPSERLLYYDTPLVFRVSSCGHLVQVFVRELISNCSDALEKLRYVQTKDDAISDSEMPLEIHIAADDVKNTLTIQDTGVGLTRDELISNLGTIARSGSKVKTSRLRPMGNFVNLSYFPGRRFWNKSSRAELLIKA